MPTSHAQTTPIRQTTTNHIASTLQAEIIAGKYPPGQRLVERELALRFKVSSIPIREALQILETQGLVAKQPNRGCSVVNLSQEETDQICELREILEPKVAEWAACRMDEDGARRLTEQAMKLQQAAESQNLSDFFEHDIEFHRIFWELSGNKYAARTLESAVGSLFASGLRAAKDIDLKTEYAKHERLLRALVDGRPSDASILLSAIAGGFRGKLGHRPADDEKNATADSVSIKQIQRTGRID